MMEKVLIIDEHLIFPPTEPMVFRDITLYSNIFSEVEVLLQAEAVNTDICYNYLRSVGAFDYVEDIILPGTVSGILLSSGRPCNIPARKLWAGNLHRILQSIRSHL
tara:strand:+ start:8342 stop:8659 length:318 start_codon:yes stop_codon:yes gene_type:complete